MIIIVIMSKTMIILREREREGERSLFAVKISLITSLPFFLYKVSRKRRKHFARCSLRHEKTSFVPGNFLSRVTYSVGFRTVVEMSFAAASIKSELWGVGFSGRANGRRLLLSVSVRM